MSSVEPGSTGANIVARAKELLLRPVPTWDVIQAEESTIEGLYRNWVLPLAAIPAVCGAIGQLGWIGRFEFFGVHFHFGLFGVLARAIAGYALNLAWVFVLAVVVDELALRFGGERSRTQAFKLVAYSSSAGWLAGVFELLPGGGVLTLLGALYGLYLFYLGLPKLMRNDPEQTTTYLGFTVLAGLGIGVLFAIVASIFSGWGGPISIY